MLLEAGTILRIQCELPARLLVHDLDVLMAFECGKSERPDAFMHEVRIEPQRKGCRPVGVLSAQSLSVSIRLAHLVDVSEKEVLSKIGFYLLERWKARFHTKKYTTLE